MGDVIMKTKLFVVGIMLILLACNLCASGKSEKIIKDREPNVVLISFHRDVSEEQITEFVSRMSHYRFREYSKLWHHSRSYWFDEKLVDDDDAFLELIKNEKIVNDAGFAEIVKTGSLDNIIQNEEKKWSTQSIGLERAKSMIKSDSRNLFTPVTAIIDRGHFDNIM